MIQTSSDYHVAIDFLTQEATISVGDINEKMSSIDANNAFGNIEMQLIDLYEKTRVLEDVQSYCRQYLMKEIAEKRQKFESRLKVIEHNADSYQDTTYVACEIPFTVSNEAVRDRDGSTIPVADIVGGKIIQSGQEIEETLFKSISKKQAHPHYRDSLSEVIGGRPYRVFYTLDNPVEGGVKEEVTINFEGVRKCNFLTIKTANCAVTDVKYINQSDAEEAAGDIDNAYGVLKNAKGLKVTICCSNYKTDNFRIDASKEKVDFWNMIEAEQFRRSAGMTSLYDMTQLTGQAQADMAQAEFQRGVKFWQEEKTKIDKRNIAAGQKRGDEA